MTRPAVHSVLDEMETCLVLQNGRLVGIDRQLSHVETKFDLSHNSVAMYFDLNLKFIGERGLPRSIRDGWSVGKQKPLARILKIMAKLWATGSCDEHVSLKDIINVQLDVNGRWPKLEQFAREKWEAAHGELRQAMRERAMSKVKADLMEAMRSGLTLEDVQDAWREIVVQKVQES